MSNNSPTPEELNDPRLGLPRTNDYSSEYPPLVRPRTEKQLANDKKMREATLARKQRETDEDWARVDSNFRILDTNGAKGEVAKTKTKGKNKPSKQDDSLDARIRELDLEEDAKKQGSESDLEQGLIPFTLPHFIRQFCPDDPATANEIVIGIIREALPPISEDDDVMQKRLRSVVWDYEYFIKQRGKCSLRLIERLSRQKGVAQATLVGLVTAEAFRKGRVLAQLTVSRILEPIVAATGNFGEKELDAGADRDRVLKMGGLLADKSPGVVVQTGAQFNAPTQINHGMQLPRLSDTTGEIHSQVMEERRRMLQPADLSGVIETERVDKREEEYVPR
jgi:hypothetical protein